ncbi:GerMN domain-containing protein [Nostocoides australiense]|nr:LpqB family beta-propeller domain-containing protein [Actinomycetota bacterium]HPF80986.1 LpqB family beta-propeller domain-containing protein [Tetrasphaera australiensis]
MTARRARALLGALLALLLSGCVGLHADPRIQPGLGVGPADRDEVGFIPPGPQDGSSPEAVIRGFLRAAGVSGQGVAVARTYLTQSLAASWNPEDRAVVTEEGIEAFLDQVATDTYSLSGTLTGTVDAQGRYEPAASATRTTARINVTQVAGQWRISGLPDGFGRWLSKAAFRQLMTPYDFYYVGPDDALVPDVRYVATDKLATRLTRGELGPVPAYLGGAVRTDLGPGVRLSVDAVPVEGGVAAIDLAAAHVSADPAARRRMWAQLVATVTQAPNVSSIAITVEGAGLDLGGLNPPVSGIDALGFQETAAPVGVLPLLRLGRGLVPTDPARIGQPDQGGIAEQPSAYPRIERTFTELALAFTGQEVAAVAEGELARFRASAGASVPNFGSNLTGPAYDRKGFLWVGGRMSGGRHDGAVWVVDSGIWPPANAPARRITASWLAGRRPVSIAIALDGARVAVISTDDKGRDARLDIAGIVRDDLGAPAGLAESPLRLAPMLSTLRDVVWLSESDVAVLGGETKQALRPYVVTLGQQVTPLPEVKGAERIVTLGGERRLFVRTADELYMRAGGRWAEVGVGDDLVVPGR